MPAAFLEGAREVVLPCSLGVLVPGLGALLLARRRGWLVMSVFVPTVAVGFWMRAAGYVDISGATWALTAMVAVGSLLIGLPDRHPHLLGGAALVGLFAASTWRPCVGLEFGKILNNMATRPAAQLIPILAFVSGLTLVLGAASAAAASSKRFGKVVEFPQIRVFGASLMIALAVATGWGRYNDLISELARISVR